VRFLAFPKPIGLYGDNFTLIIIIIIIIVVVIIIIIIIIIATQSSSISHTDGRTPCPGDQRIPR
jgi:uncharacterized membrane protein